MPERKNQSSYNVPLVPTLRVESPPLALLRLGIDDAGASGGTSRRWSVGTMSDGRPLVPTLRVETSWNLESVSGGMPL